MVAVVVVLVVVAVCAAVALAVVFGVKRSRPNVVLFIGDGLGMQLTTLARFFAQHNMGDPLDFGSAGCQTSVVTTSSASHFITDSAAAATAMSCGRKTTNGRVGVTPDGKPCGTVLEAAALAGMATGIAVTSTVSHATPAGFTAHVVSRSNEESIARQQLQQFADGRLDVLIGGGKDVWEGAGLLDRACELGITVAFNLSQINESISSQPQPQPLLGLLGQGKMQYEIDLEASTEERPSMSELAVAAWNALLKTKQPFFLMVEGSLIDFAEHSNDAATAVRETLAFFLAVSNIIDLAQQEGNTIVLVTSDHDTGGLSLGSNAINLGLLSAANASIETMASLAFRSSTSVESVLLSRAGVSQLSSGEIERLEKAKNTSEGALQDEIALVISDRLGVSWGSDGHTATDVLLFSCLSGSAGKKKFPFFQMNNTDIPLWIADVLDLDLNATTADTIARFATDAAFTAVPKRSEPISDHN